jgi:F-type H+-transporting ATPase subunit epsilon
MAGEQRMVLEIVTPSAMMYNGPVDMVVIPARDGELGILPGHSVMMAAITSGELQFKVGDTWRSLAVSSGYAEVSADLVIMIANAAEWAEEIDVPRAQKALARAEARMADPQTRPLDKVHARHALQRAAARIKVAQQHAQKQNH